VRGRAHDSVGRTPRMRLIPATLRSRVSLTLVVVVLALFAAVFTVTWLVMSYHIASLARAQALRDLDSVRYDVVLQTRELDGYVLNNTEWNEFYERTLSPDDAFTAEGIDPWLIERSGATVAVWTDASGTVIWEHGNPDDVAALLTLADARPETLGASPLPSGPAVVVARAIVGDPATTPAGTLALARAIPRERTSALPEQAGSVRTIVDPAGSLPPGLDELDAPPEGYLQAGSTTRDESMETYALLAGADGAPAAIVRIVDTGTWTRASGGLAVYALPLGLGGLTMLVAFALGTVLSNLVRKPIEQSMAYLHEQGLRAVDGLPFDERLELDPRLPDDFMELGRVVEDLMNRLQFRQEQLAEATRQARDAEAALRRIVDESPEAKLLVVDGRVEIANPAAGTCLLQPPDELISCPVNSVVESMSIAAESGEPLEFDDLVHRAARDPMPVRCRMADGSERWMLVSVSPIDLDRRTFVLSARNISEERRLEALRAEIISLVSHDLRSPLTVVRGYLDILERHPTDAERAASAIERAREAIGRMEVLLDDLLSATRAERILAPRIMRPLDAMHLATSVAESLRVGATQTIEVRAAETTHVLGDRLRLEQALTNLVANAIKYAPEGSVIDVVVERAGERVLFAVEDHGPGVPEESRERVFERFTRLDERGRTTPGVGLGLYIVRVIVEAHGGGAYVEDSPRGGARFVISLPIAEGS